ncbi:MAG: hypothetical protein M1616_05940 [Candidatus Thermoplasmatota archaeon]|jgi:uncharacterized OB-fold protein|nr:hypothetical protein [Candidatus Thermoplasmatota archaeon]
MKIYRCRNCKNRFLVFRFICPSCGMTGLETVPVIKGKVIETVMLKATPEPFPENYSVVKADSDGIIVFCRTLERLQKGDEIMIEDDDLGPVCSKI